MAILGASGYIGKSLAQEFMSRGLLDLALFARAPEELKQHGWPENIRCEPLNVFDAGEFDLVINAIGAGDPARVASMGSGIFAITQHWDDAVLDSMGAGTRYVFLSSGAVYGGEFDQPVASDSVLTIPVNRITDIPAYTIAKLYTEAKHRAYADRAILDLRVFGYADDSIDRNGHFFLSDLAGSIADLRPFLTSEQDMVRDYAGRRELADLILAWKTAGAPNSAADLFTIEPLSKNRLLDIVQNRYGLEVRRSAGAMSSPTGNKSVYASRHMAAVDFGYTPQRTSLQIVLEVLDRVAFQSGHQPTDDLSMS